MEQTMVAPAAAAPVKYNWWKEVHPLAKTAIVLVGTGVALWGGYKGYVALSDYIAQRKSRQTVDSSKGELKTLQQQGVSPSYSDSQYLDWAESLQQQFDGCGTGSSVIMPIYANMKNDADIHKLIVAYGTRTIDKCGIGTGDFSGDLPSTMSYKFSGVEGSLNPTVVPTINAYFAKQGMSFKF